MILERAELHQICQHENLVVDLKPGLIGILGPNGAGKSNFVNMLKASLTGDFSVNPGVKDDNVRWGMPDDDYSAVTTVWRHENESFAIRRALKNTTNYLKRDGQKDLRQTKEITAEIERLLGIPKQVLNFMFVAQWEMFAFISADPAVRASTFAHLCGTAKIEKLHKLAGEELKATRAAAESVRDTRGDLQQRILERTARLKEIEREQEAIGKDMLPVEKRLKLQQAIDAGVKYSLLVERTEAVQKRLDTATSNVLVSKQELAKAKQLAEVHAIELAGADKAAKEAEAKLNEWRAHQKHESRREVLEAILAERKWPVPPAPEYYEDRKTIRADLAALTTSVQRDKSLIKLIDAGQAAECPTCFTPTRNLTKTVIERKRTLAEREAEIRNLTEMLNSFEAHDSAMSTYRQQASEQRERQSAAKLELELMPPRPEKLVPMDAKKVLALVTDAEEKRRCQIGYDLRLRNAETSFAKFEALQTQAQTELEQLEKELSGLYSVNTEALKAQLDKHDNAAVTYKILTGRWQDLKELNDAEEAEIKKVTELLDATAVARTWVADLEAFREVAHHDNFPKLAAQRWLFDVTDLVNKTLVEFESPFRVEVGEDLSFVAVKPDGRKEKAERLSGGQKMLLAFAFRFAVNKLLAGDVGMMILDEPTAGVDRTNVDNMTDILRRLSSYTKDKGRQIMIITHDETLERAFDQTIYIGKQP
jgi:DNA repair exonuclease SbcCD ATPase subunit